MSTATPIEHKVPTVATVKLMYATAFRCGHPKCQKPLYRMNDATGDLTLNSTVAHIHARRENGPRWDSTMSEEDNRAEANLILLCLEHSWEIDAVPDDYPPDEIRSWKVAVRAEYDKLQRSWDLTEDQVAEVFAASFDSREFARTVVESEALTQCIRLGATLMEQVAAVRRPATLLATSWVELGDRYTRQAMAWGDDGELLRVEPPGVERQRFRTEMIALLQAARDQVEPTVQSLAAELRALKATNVELAKWSDWVEQTARKVLADATSATLEVAPAVDTDDLSSALDALAAKWRGEEPPEPPAAPALPAATEPSPNAKARAALEVLVRRARPWARVQTRDYDADLYDDLVESLAYSASLPPIVSNMPLILTTVCGLAADVARNADDETFLARVAEAALLDPIAAAVGMLNNLKSMADETGRPDASREAARLAEERLAAETWSDAATWEANILHTGTLLTLASAQTDDETVRALVAEALPSITPTHLHLGIAEWREQFANLDLQGPGRPDPYIGRVPTWIPSPELETATRATWPDLSDDDLESQDTERRLAAEYLFKDRDPSSTSD